MVRANPIGYVAPQDTFCLVFCVMLLDSSLGRRDGRGACRGRSPRKRTTQMTAVISTATRLLVASQRQNGGFGTVQRPSRWASETEHRSSSVEDSAEQQVLLYGSVVFAGKVTHGSRAQR